MKAQKIATSKTGGGRRISENARGAGFAGFFSG
jgi:hypothetical protein